MLAWADFALINVRLILHRLPIKISGRFVLSRNKPDLPQMLCAHGSAPILSIGGIFQIA